MEYITPKQCAEKWGISPRAVQILCSTGKISGAKQVGKMWFIPFNAIKPIDGRTKKAKKNTLSQNYRFPLFIFSDLFYSTNILTEEENDLRDAQVLYLQGKYEESLILCHQIINETIELHIKIGAYVTIAYNTVLLKLAGEFKSTISTLKALIENSIYNQEDYKLIYEGLIYHLSWDPSPLFEINIDKLSFEAIPYYQYIMLLSNVINMLPLHKQTISIVSSINKYSYTNKIEPLNVMLDFLLAFIYFKDGNKETCANLVNSACNISIKNNWTNCLSKFYAMLSTFIDNYINSVNTNYLEEIQKVSNLSVLNWRFISKAYNGGTTLDDIPIELFDYLILIVRGKTNDEIASIKNLPIDIIDSKINELSQITQTETRDELISYAKTQFEKFKS